MRRPRLIHSILRVLLVAAANRPLNSTLTWRPLDGASRTDGASPGDASLGHDGSRVDSGRSGSRDGSAASSVDAFIAPDGQSSGDIPRHKADVEEPDLRVIAWNGRTSAVSFTFDDVDVHAGALSLSG